MTCWGGSSPSGSKRWRRLVFKEYLKILKIFLKNLNIQFGGANTEFTLQVKDSRGNPRVARFSSRAEMSQIKNAIDAELESETREQFDSLV